MAKNIGFENDEDAEAQIQLELAINPDYIKGNKAINQSNVCFW